MKKIILASIVILLSLLTNFVQAQEKHEDHINYVVLTRNVPQLKPILLAAEELAVQDGENFGDFQVIICGKAVQDLTDNVIMTDFLEKAKKTGVIINACGFSLKKFNVDRTKIPAGVQIVENGILYNFELQKKAYLSIEL
ncbi:sulfur reduction protein DsrE [Salinimicrobium oceani]|uniref:Sulfur reduction protein DsrE n=1 Tax=Salinimicrobium oceani TaxID=2722702 RepID=A0ABX1CX43_9FLAO|nr:sulfur reduction protein DsrE [Salinimicrobium oceani]NJW51519.1 sulfur reduction protein DsrE [Salinimicrobium oceani]